MKFSRLPVSPEAGGGALFAGARQWRLSLSLEAAEGYLLGGQVTGTAFLSFRSVYFVAGGVEAIEEWVRSVGVHSPGAKAGAGQSVWPGGP